MAQKIEDIIDLCCEVSADIKVAVRNAAKGAMVAATTTFFGGLLGGPVGLAVGGAGGGLFAAWLTSGQFKPLPQILMELPSNQKQLLYKRIEAVLGDLDWKDAAQLIAFVMGNAAVKGRVLAALLKYVEKELQAEICYDD